MPRTALQPTARSMTERVTAPAMGRITVGSERLARQLGLFSIALGVLELLGGRTLGRAMGLEGRSGLFRFYGLREIGTGIGILAFGRPTPWIWGRVVGDALDLATLAPGLDRRNPDRHGARVAVAAVCGAMALDVLCVVGLELTRGRRR